jgi:hypothetical protein
MRRTTPASSNRNSPWRSRIVRLALALAATAFTTAMAAAEIGARPGLQHGDDLLAKVIRRQRVAQGLPANAPATTTPAAPDPDSREGILAEAAKIEAQMNQDLSHIQQLQVVAYLEKNLIRMNFLAAKIEDMKQVMAVTSAALADLRQPGADVFVMRAKLTTLRQGAERVKSSATEAESKMNDDSPDSLDIGASNAEGSPSKSDTDPTDPPSATSDFNPALDRPSEASPFQ